MRIISTFIIFIFLITSAQAGVVFEDNFDDHDDWSPTQPPLGQSSYDCGASCSTQPDGYHSYYIKHSVYNPAGNNTININNSQYRGGSGKAFIHWSESDSGSNWPADGQLSLELPSEYTEIYVRFYIKFQSDWEWATGMSPGQKFSRTSHYVGGSPFSYHDPRNQRPLSTALLNKSSSSSYVRATTNFRYEVTKYPSEASPSHDDTEDGFWGGLWDDEGNPGDGDWHCWEHYVKLNSAPGEEDGEVRFWIDGVELITVTDLAFSDDGASGFEWNYVVIGGNENNPWAPVENEEEQWYAIDDLVISTEYVGLTYEIGGGDSTDPEVTITSPTSNPTYSTASNSLNIAGSASDNVGVTSVDWDNDVGSNGTCTGTTSWSQNSIALSEGANVITVTANDAAENTGTDILTVTLDSTAPVISNVLPTGSHECTGDPRNIDLTCTTDESATCKYDTSDVAYASMGDTFGTTGSTSHSETLNLACDDSYTYYIRCIDGLSNANGSSSTASFSIGVEVDGEIRTGGNGSIATGGNGGISQ